MISAYWRAESSLAGVTPSRDRHIGSVFVFLFPPPVRRARRPHKCEGPPPPGKRPFAIVESLLVLPDVLGLQALRSLHDVELHAVALGQRPEALHLNGGVVDEYVLSALLRDEAEALAVAEPLHRALRHESLLFVTDGHPPCPRRVVPPVEIGSRPWVSDQREARTRKQV